MLAGDVPAVCALLTRATTADVNTTVSSTDRRTVLHLACSSGRVVVVQLLLWVSEVSELALDGWAAGSGNSVDELVQMNWGVTSLV